MDGDPMVPESMKGNTKFLVYGGVGAMVIFTFIAIIMCFVNGGKQSNASYFVIAIGLVFLLISVCVMLNWVRQGTVEEKLKYVLVAQLFCMLFLDIGAFMDMYKAAPSCPGNPQCYNDMINFLNGQLTCATGGAPPCSAQCCANMPSCFNALSGIYPPVVANNATVCVSYLQPQVDAQELAYPKTFKIEPATAPTPAPSSPTTPTDMAANPTVLTAAVPMPAMKPRANAAPATDMDTQARPTAGGPARSAHGLHPKPQGLQHM